MPTPKNTRRAGRRSGDFSFGSPDFVIRDAFLSRQVWGPVYRGLKESGDPPIVLLWALAGSAGAYNSQNGNETRRWPTAA
jgi:hypothetical protein